ncbi:amidohydrolase family protein [Uliginosibacterium sp. sgz301328]|uniref:metal-dependent hydrolase family protein n=1 Tax=Uliginosibacterium sp. sgz301328 TaxID=3243764 RepID=UPI00359D58C7
MNTFGGAAASVCDRLKGMPLVVRRDCCLYKSKAPPDTTQVVALDRQFERMPMHSLCRTLSGKGAVFLLALAILTSASSSAQEPGEVPKEESPARPTQATTLFKNVRVFDGLSGQISAPRDVLVRGNKIERIATQVPVEPATLVIDGTNRVLMPGLSDVHWHMMFAAVSFATAMNGDRAYLALAAGAEATRTLMRGFTTVRDMGGSTFGLKEAIDQGLLPGPRVFPSGAMISVTGGHGDFRSFSDLPRQYGAPGSRHDIDGDSTIADGPDEVRMRAREQLMRGASQIKLTAGGGVTSPHSPLDVVTFTEAELRAAVEAAGNWGTYVAAHAFTSTAVAQAISAGVKCIEHGFLMDEETAQLMARKGIWLSTQPIPEELAYAFPRDSDQWNKAQEVFTGVDRTYTLAKKYKLKTAFGTDVLFSAALASQQGGILASLTKWYTPAQVLVMATGTNGELLALSGKRSPYPGTIGVVREGALADLLLVNGDPVADISLITKPDESFAVIMKDGVIYKNQLSQPKH